MESDVVKRIKDAFEGMFADKKTLIKILSVVLILIAALILRIHDEGKADITIETADNAAETEYSENNDATKDENSDSQSAAIYVDIGGAVKKPGVYQVSDDTRLFQAIEMAGGLTEYADADHVNRASFVEDGQKIVIPVKGSEYANDIASESEFPAGAENGLININTASADELKTLTGIGDVTAEKIIEYRSSTVFKSKEDIMSVNGIGSKIYEKIKDRITV